MKLYKPHFEEIRLNNTLKQIERCARVCYKSENRIEEGSDLKIIGMLAQKDHSAMLEHGTVYLKFRTDQIVWSSQKDSTNGAFNKVMPFNDYNYKKIADSPYSRSVYKKIDNVCYVTTNLRVIFENNKDMYDAIIEHHGETFDNNINGYTVCKYEDYPEYFVQRVTIIFTMDRIDSQSFCRHRVMSFAQESTRWCNYIKEKFGHEISVMQPCWLKPEDQTEFEEDMKIYEALYFKWIEKGYRAEEARVFLPFDLKTEIVMTGYIDGWQHFFSLRDDSHAHESAQELAKPLKEYFIEKGYIVK